MLVSPWPPASGNHLLPSDATTTSRAQACITWTRTWLTSCLRLHQALQALSFPCQPGHSPRRNLCGLHTAFGATGPYNRSSKQEHLRMKGGTITNHTRTTGKDTLGNWKVKSSYCRINPLPLTKLKFKTLCHLAPTHLSSQSF